ncbi:hypothetical protein L3X38_010947 [Prunus dulcis]|uniref:Uncharacterized protein n=1 Tax=Prunus dulcis TaxID=3755 RepID=A0AAD4ZEX6_PRUDU|nr:hypothetical protein L3X38_010947 [Prunus dulcis]
MKKEPQSKLPSTKYQQVERAHNVTKPPTEDSNNIFHEGDLITKYDIYNGGIEIGFEMFRKYAQLVDAGSTKWDKIKVYEAIAMKRAP